MRTKFDNEPINFWDGKTLKRFIFSVKEEYLNGI